MSFDMTVREFMHDADNLMAADEPVKNAKQQFELETVRSLILIDASGPVGLLTRGRMRELSDADLELKARDVAVTVPVLKQTQTLADARTDLGSVDFDADRIPVVDDSGLFVGVVDREVIMRESETVLAGRGAVTDENGQPLHTIVVGMDVLGTDGNKLGKVDEIVLERDHVASFTIEHGLLGRHHKRVAADHVANADDEAVYLDFGKTEFGFLSDVEDLDEEHVPTAAS